MVVAKAFEKVLKHGEQRKDAVVASLALATRLGDRSRWSFTRPFVGCPINSELELSGASRPFGYEPGIRRDLTTVWLRQNIKLALGLGLGLYRIVIYIYNICIHICSENRAHSTGHQDGWCVDRFLLGHERLRDYSVESIFWKRLVVMQMVLNRLF